MDIIPAAIHTEGRNIYTFLFVTSCKINRWSKFTEIIVHLHDQRHFPALWNCVRTNSIIINACLYLWWKSSRHWKIHTKNLQHCKRTYNSSPVTRVGTLPPKLAGFSHVWFLRDICPNTNKNWLTLLKTVLWFPNIHFHENMYVRNHCYIIRNSQLKSAHKKCFCIQIPGNCYVLFPPTRAQAHIIYDKAARVNKHSVYNVLNGSFKTII